MIRKKKNNIHCKWEWPAGRKPEYQLTVVIVAIKNDSPGLFGVKHSPSVLGGIPGGVILRGKIIENDAGLSETTLSLLLPGEEIPAAKKGDTVVLGIIHPDTCIAVTKHGKDTA